MMQTPLLLTAMMERAEKFYPEKHIVSRTESGIHRFTYKEWGKRTRRLGSVLKDLGVEEGDKVGTLAWNHHRHLEAYFAIPCIGAVLHTINIRLSPQHIVYIINHAKDRVLLVDPDLLPLVEKIRDQIPHVESIIVMTDGGMPESPIEGLHHYEELLEKGDPTFSFRHDLDENAPAGMCYTSATTGNPKGVVYSHRGIVLHAMALGLADTTGLMERDVALPVVPMFHVNAWGLPFASVWFGTTQVLPGPYFTPGLLAQLMEKEKVTVAAGVPTIWLGLLRELEENTYDLSSVRYLLCGGSAAPRGMIKAFEEKHGIPFMHAYGMTETSPLAVVASMKSQHDVLSDEERFDVKAKQGILVPGLEMKVIGKDGEVEWNGREMGELALRGPWIASEYYQDDRTEDAFRDGWLHTGDVVTIDEEGYIKIVDRTKDLIKSGGEWISSVDLENALMSHEDVFEAAVVAVPHEEWQERPVACVVLKDAEKRAVTEDEIIDFLRPQFAKWWLPDKVIFMKEIPKTSVGKFLKMALRDEIHNKISQED
ncbi:long-chain fatty acid--CoA ligase [Rossellomorea marisflavi]|uniref:Fatty-acid--CoA ligase n=1 Tax=Rossellomorea marisflavi TaxID=189381 RepID=A0A165K1B8_9BACI|nr:long-chain fatty acid--CoA ligase [Rossellomorea marisflavi]KML06077.1 fatty-acid--CoA ligase [Rossellomorea marisflavi]KZE47692.1 fatty-acid--CoA ligase [Rossellomorea marisflavi]QHA35782.1 long-chain-fatty-acid--CoA ligase [Rossellomorea marisflavi]USK93700.1 long-chain fatty acid--CoA ligase [Rossellomorea marisflavi]